VEATNVGFHQTACRFIPEDRTFHILSPAYLLTGRFKAGSSSIDISASALKMEADISASALKMEAICSSEKSVVFTGLHGIISQKIEPIITTDVRT
jgi:hypothetical protein